MSVVNRAENRGSDVWGTPAQFCAAFKISKATFWRLVAAGKVDTIKLGARCTRVRLDRLPEAERKVA